LPRKTLDPYIDDLRTCTHEAGHAVAIALNGGALIRVIGHRHFATGDERGSVEYLRRGMTPWQEAFCSLAGRAVSEGFDVLVDADTPDEGEAAELVGPEAMPALRRAVATWAMRADVQRAVTAVANMLAENPVLPGIPIEIAVRAALAPARGIRTA